MPATPFSSAAAEPRGTRPVLLLVGPSGIGKTATLRRLGRQLRDEGYLYFHVELREPLRDTVVKLLRILDSYLPGSGEAAGSLVEAVTFNARTPLELLRNIFEKLLEQSDTRIVFVLDEAQHLLQEGESSWSLLKVLSGLQEDYRGRFSAILSTSDYQFQRVLFEEAHSPTYIDVFYLGEMTRDDAAALAERLAGRSVDERLVDRVGGNPSLIQLAVLGPDRPEEAVHREVRKYVQFILSKLARYSLSERVSRFLLDVLSGPQPLTRFYGFRERDWELLWSLVKGNVLQLGCREYIGVYGWNPGCVDEYSRECGGGGLCGALDVVAPASRPALAALAAAVTGCDSVELAGLELPQWALGLVEDYCSV